MWINFFFIHPELMNIAGRIAQSINPDADPDIVQMMIDYKGGIVPLFDTKGEGALGGMNIVFTGKSEYFIGDDMEDFLRKNGANTSHTVTKKTDLLVLGTKPSQNKINKAKELGIDIMDEWQLYFRNAETLKHMPENVRERI
jgi:NAD-dependent DNA ligase